MIPKTESKFEKATVIPFKQFMVVNSYLIKGLDNKYLLIDSIYPGKKAETVIDSALKEKDVEFCLVTHGHMDHYGQVKHIIEKYPNSRIIAKKECFESMERGGQSDSKPYTFGMKIMFAFMKVFSKPNDEEIAIKVEEKNKLEFENLSDEIKQRLKGNYDVEIIETPGHTNCHISVFREEVSEMFVGDTMNGNQKKVDYFFLILDKDKIHSSIKKIVELNPKEVHASHIAGPISVDIIKKKFEKEIK